MLNFVDSLKQIIADTQATGGMIIERASPSPQLLQKLREYAVQSMAQANTAYQLQEWFIERSFDEHVRACIVHLHKLGIIQDDRVYHLISKVIDAVVETPSMTGQKRRSHHFEEQLIYSLE